MKHRKTFSLYASLSALLAFAVWTVLVCTVDVRPIGPLDSRIGLATLNGWIYRATGVNWTLYTLTDWFGLVPFAVALGFACLGLYQWIKRKRLFLVDRSLFVLGGFYLAVIAVYVLFELVVINRRPVLIEGILEASYPSSTTLLVACVIPTALMQICSRLQRKALRICVLIAGYAFVAFMVIGRIFSGVHWISDIIGGAFLCVGLLFLYRYFETL